MAPLLISIVMVCVFLFLITTCRITEITIKKQVYLLCGQQHFADIRARLIRGAYVAGFLLFASMLSIAFEESANSVNLVQALGVFVLGIGGALLICMVFGVYTFFALINMEVNYPLELGSIKNIKRHILILLAQLFCYGYIIVMCYHSLSEEAYGGFLGVIGLIIAMYITLPIVYVRFIKAPINQLLKEKDREFTADETNKIEDVDKAQLLNHLFSNGLESLISRLNRYSTVYTDEQIEEALKLHLKQQNILPSEYLVAAPDDVRPSALRLIVST